MAVSGATAAALAFRLCDRHARVRVHVRDGQSARPGQVILEIRARARALLTAERTALNFLGRLSGIATLTRRFVRAVPKGCRTKILDTRKTTPLLRALEKDAVRHGGGTNHRRTLSESVLIKDNHVMLHGGVGRAVRAARRTSGRGMPIEVEVGTLDELREALDSRADRVLLDNMSIALVRRAVQIVAGRIPIEVSGGVTLDRIAALARLGVDFISIGALTHSAPAAKLSMNIYPVRTRG